MRENMTFLTNYYQIREMTIDRMKEIIDQNKNAKELSFLEILSPNLWI